MGAPDTNLQSREHGIDAFRFFMVILVIIIHRMPGSTSSPMGMTTPIVMIDVLCRSAVPFFFVTSGYFLKTERSVCSNSRYALLRLAPAYAFWSAVYLAVAWFVNEKWPLHWPAMLLLEGGGPGFHLWFLPALAFSLVIVAVSLRMGGRSLALIVGVALAVVGPVMFDYHSLLGIARYPEPLSALSRFLAAPLFVVIGLTLQKAPTFGLTTATALFGGSMLFLLAERYFVTLYVGNAGIRTAEGLVFTYAMGASAFAMARSLNTSALAKRLAPLGLFSFAIYVCHVLLIWLVDGLLPQFPGRNMAVLVLVVLGSLLIAAVMVRTPGLRKLVT